jgi:hypothetical protein
MTKKFRAISLLLTYWAFGIATWDAVPTMYHEVATAYASCKKRCKVEHQLCIRKNNPGCSWLCCDDVQLRCFAKCRPRTQ